MELQAIKTFLTIVKCGSFQSAANELQYAQSTITIQIQKLEQQLDLKLLTRGKKIQLTEAGKAFLEQALPIINNIENLQKTMTSLSLGDSGSVKIGSIEPSASFYLPKILFPFMSSHPKVQISIIIGNTGSFSKLIQKQEMDFAICSIPEPGIDLHFEPLFYEPLVLLVPKTHNLFKKKEIDINDLQNQRFLATSIECPYRIKMEATFRELGVAYSIIEIDSLASIKHYVQANYGLAFMPSTFVSAKFPGIATRNVRNLDFNLITGILYNDNSYSINMAARKLIELVKQGLAHLILESNHSIKTLK